MQITETYNRIRKFAPAFNQFMLESAHRAHNEAEFEYDMNNEIGRVAKQLGVQLLFRQQYTLATGRADAVYNRFVIEYEPPKSLRGSLIHKHTAHAVQQVRDYIEGVAKEEKHDRDRLLGVTLDGSYYIFVRYHEGHWIFEEPVAANTASSERFLRSLFSLASGRALIPDNLVEDFGSQNEISQKVTRALYNALGKHTDDLTGRLYAQWILFFGQTAGYEAAAGELQHKKELHAFARGMGLKDDEVDMPRFFFALHTYFAFLVENIARLVLQAFAGGALGATPLTTVASMDGEALKRELQKWEDGDIYRALGLKNLLEGDFFSWYLSAWDPEIEDALRQVLARLADYNPVTVQDDPHSARDLLKKLYHYLLPREIRHDLGEFYTPDWLAERLLTQLGEPLFQMPKPGARIPTPNKRLLDPACGSGTFLILAARALKANCFQAGLAEAETLEIILHSLAGIDLNPLAVMAARVNLLLAVADLLPYRRHDVELPIYLADSILTPAQGGDIFTHNRRILETAVGSLPVPDVINTRAEMERLTGLLEEYVTGDFSPESFVTRCRKDLPDVAANPQSEPVLQELFQKLNDLHHRRLDGIWARVLKNAFMPLFLERFDYVVGNPPWINWESLPDSYRKATADLWAYYGLEAHKGKGQEQFELGKQKRDISTLMTYVVSDRYLKAKGKLGFVITQSVWKTGASSSFRRFLLPNKGRISKNEISAIPLRILHVDDLSRLQVFEGAATRTSVFILQKGENNRYPVPYTSWLKTIKGTGLDYDSTLEEVLSLTKQRRLSAIPINSADITSAWLTAREKSLGALHKIIGKSEFKAHAGTVNWANGIYWMEILSTKPNNMLIVRNLTEGSKTDVDNIIVEIESDLVYPLLRGGDLNRWHASQSMSILLPHTPKTLWQAIPEDEMQVRYPKTWSYLSRFRQLLLSRSGYQLLRQGHPFYICNNVTPDIFAPFKVVWPNMGNDLCAAVVSNVDGKPIIPQHIVSLVATEFPDEAYYIAAVINSNLFQFTAHSYSQSGKSFGTPQILNNLRIPTYNPEDPVHVELSKLSLQAHTFATQVHTGEKGSQDVLNNLEDEINQASAQLWGLTVAELIDITISLSELKGNDVKKDRDDKPQGEEE